MGSSSGYTPNPAHPRASLREPMLGFGGQYRHRTPAMAAGLDDQVLTVEDILTKRLISIAA